jgi:D-beta-D-heptose 7-phosphate kinase/D-beta-D-heptose 1-phosphate adenosyltransferase
VVVGDTLLDRDLEGTSERLSPEAPVPVVDDPVETLRAGGAGLAACLAARDGREVTLVTALSADETGERLRRLLEDEVRVVDLGLDGPTPEKTRIRSNGQPVVRLDRGGGGLPRPPARQDAVDAVRGAAAVLVSDYGHGVPADETLRSALRDAALDVSVVWDPHPRGATPIGGAALVTPNRGEATRFSPAVQGEDLAAVAARARALCNVWDVGSVAVTLGAAGAVLVASAAPPLVISAPLAADGDSCGAGDRFAATAAGLLAEGAHLGDAVQGAVDAATAFVAAGGASGLGRLAPPPPDREDAYAVAARVRRSGGTVVATGGCFDLLHAGHVTMLQSARALGDCLVVCLNSDESIRRLKGPDRPLVTEDDRAEVLEALACVDAVLVFDEDTPTEALRRLRPHVWAKGGDYEAAELPEAEIVRAGGGEAVILPYVAGRSTSRLLEEVASHVAR